MEFEEIRYEVADGILQITLDRPDRLNAFTGTMGRELIEAFDRADADDAVRAVIVTGAGRGFCAGADRGAGGEGFVFARRGIVPEACSSWFLPRIVGISQAMEWTATGRVFSAEEARAGGLVRSLHPGGELLGAARELAAEIAEHTSPVSVAMTRRLMWTMLGAAHPMAAHRADSRGMFFRGQSAD